MNKIFISLVLLCVTLYAERPVVTVTIEPQKAILERIVKDKVKIKTVFMDSNFKIKFKKLTLKKLASSDIYMTFGMDIEKELIEKVKKQNPNLEIYDMARGIKKIKNNGKANPYIWMDPLKVRAVAEMLYLKFAKLDPKNAPFYGENYNKFVTELDEIYLKIKMLYTYTNFSIYAFDDYWDYFADRFDFPIYKFEKRVLNAEEIPDFIVNSKKRVAKVLLVDPKTPSRVSKSLAGNSNVQIIENDIFKYEWMGNLFLLAETINSIKK